MIAGSFGRIGAKTARDHETGRAGGRATRAAGGRGSAAGGRGSAAGGRGSAAGVPGRVRHLVTDALPPTSAGYTIRTHEIALAQREAGLDPYVATRCGYPVTQGRIDGRRLVVLDGVPYHRLLPWRMPSGPGERGL